MISLRRLALVGLVAVATVAPVALAPPAAHAQRTDLKQEARRLVVEGLAAQDAGRYADAIDRYERAYRLIPHPEILFNLGQAYRLSGDDRAALGYYRRYLAVDPNGRVVADARRWVAELEAAVATSEGSLAARTEAARRRDQLRTRRTFRIAGLATGGAGALALVVGLKYGLDARSISDDLSGHDGPWTDDLLARQDKGRRAEQISIVASSIGAVAVLGGAVLYYLGARPVGEQAVAVTPMVGGGVAGALVTGQF